MSATEEVKEKRREAAGRLEALLLASEEAPSEETAWDLLFALPELPPGDLPRALSALLRLHASLSGEGAEKLPWYEIHTALERPEPDPRAIATEALRLAGWATDTAGLLDLLGSGALGSGAPFVSALAARALGARPEALPALCAMAEQEPPGEWMERSHRNYRLAVVAEALGPEHGARLLAAVWGASAEDYRDTHWRIGRCLRAFDAGSAAAFLAERLTEAPRPLRALRAIHEQAFGREEAFAPLREALLALGGHADPAVARSAKKALARIDEGNSA